MNQTKITFAFVGRITKEKWFDLIYDRLQYLRSVHSPLLDLFTLDIYGDGPLRDQAQEVSDLLVNTTYHGQVPFDKIIHDIRFFDYNLMPSTFLETFGLTALDFALHGVPTIWYAKWWLKQLIIDPVLDIYNYAWESDYDKFIHCMKYILHDIDRWRYADIKQKTLDMYSIYDKEKRLKNFDEMIDTLDK